MPPAVGARVAARWHQRTRRRSRRLLLGYAHRELAAPFAPPTAENFASGPRPHSLAKSVRALAALAVGLKGPLHDILRDFTMLPRARRASGKTQTHSTGPGHCQRGVPGGVPAHRNQSACFRRRISNPDRFARESPSRVFGSCAGDTRKRPCHAAFRHRIRQTLMKSVATPPPSLP